MKEESKTIELEENVQRIPQRMETFLRIKKERRTEKKTTIVRGIFWRYSTRISLFKILSMAVPWICAPISRVLKGVPRRSK